MKIEDYVKDYLKFAGIKDVYQKFKYGKKNEEEWKAILKVATSNHFNREVTNILTYFILILDPENKKIGFLEAVSTDWNRKGIKTFNQAYQIIERDVERYKEALNKMKEKVVESKKITTNDNYFALKKYLTETNKNYSKDQFKAVLYCMQGLTIYNQTKKEVLDQAKKKYGIPKTFLDTELKEMGIKSTRSTYNRYVTQKHIVDAKILKRRLEEDTDFLM